jgi:hypothetical protein
MGNEVGGGESRSSECEHADTGPILSSPKSMFEKNCCSKFTSSDRPSKPPSRPQSNRRAMPEPYLVHEQIKGKHAASKDSPS